MPTETLTHCFSTRDAVERGDGYATFEFKGSRNGAQKVMLGSLEFPMVQWTIEAEWSRIYTSESLRVAPDGRELTFQNDCELTLTLPVTLNACKLSRALPSCDVAVVCEHPHGLFAGGVALDDALRRCKLLSTPCGDVHVHSHTLLYVDERTFVIQGIRDACGLTSTVEPAILHCPLYDSPHDVCAVLNEIASKTAAATVGVDLVFSYDARADRVGLRARPRSARTSQLLTLLASPLQCVLGLAPITCRLAERWPSQGTQIWDYFEVEPGFYTPCHRPMSIGPPNRLTDTVESTANRMYFPILQGEGVERFHLLVFADPKGSIFRSRILPGHYAPEALAVHVQRGMMGAVEGLDIVFEVRYEDERFVFTCACKHRGTLVPTPFSIYFHHPQSIDPKRLGFPPTLLTGECTYRSASPVRIPRRPVSGTMKAFSEARSAPESAQRAPMRNLLRLSDVPAQKRFRFSATTTPNLVGVIVKHAEGATTVVTYVNREPFSHGLVVGDVVRLSAYKEPRPPGDADYTPLAAETDGELPNVISAVVLDTNGVAELTVSTPALALFKTIRSGLTIQPVLSPWCMHFGRERSVPAHALGFEPRAYCTGADGETEPSRAPPFLAPFVHSLDHPDYVLLTLTNTVSGSIDHCYGGNVKNVFAKLVLYPLFREERMLPRDAPTLGPSAGRFTIGIFNPDGTRYKFHGAHFSFSLNFLIATPTGGAEQ
jgi:hypothetical protein